MKWFVPVVATVLALFLFVSCKGEDEKAATGGYTIPGLCEACLEVMPNADDFEIRIPKKEDKSGEKGLGDLAEYYTFTVQISRDLNFWILGILSTLDEMLSHPPTQSSDSTCVWGPFIPDGLSPVEVRFSMTKNSDADYEYIWDERLKNTSDEFQPIWGGNITPSTETARRGIGNLFIDFTTARQLDPTWDVSGRMDVNYDTYTDGRRIDIAFDQFVSDDGGFPTDADYHYHNHADNSGEFSFVYEADFPLDGNPDGVQETANQETLWHGSGEGISTLTVSGGDLTGYEFFGITVAEIEGKECWNEVFERTYYHLQLIPEESDPIDLEPAEGLEEDCPGF